VLEVWYSGPETTLQRIPAGALWREETNSSTPPRWVNGVNYRTVDVPGEALPRFELAVPVAVGSSPNFDPSVAGRDEHVGVQFDGFLDVPRSGVYTFELRSDDGSRLYVGAPAFRMAVYETVAFPRPVPFASGQILQPGEDRVWAVVEGVVHLVSATGNGMRLELGEGTTRVRVEVADRRGLTADSLLRRSIKVTGFCQAAMTLAGQRVPGILLTPGAAQIQVLAASEEPVVTAPPDTTVLPTLRTAARVHRLKREEAERGYPVILRGTVTSVLPEHQAVTLQDATRGIYVVDASSNGTYTPQIGEYLEIEGATDPSYFAPIVNARRMSRLGPGQLPSSVIPTWEQLLTGSLDAQFVEISGVVTAVHSNSISLFMREGVVEVELRVIGPEPSDLSQFENALVRVRGCLFASWDYQTHQFRPGTVRIYGADVLVDQPAPSDLFAIPPKSAAELRMFDPQAGLFRRVKVASQVTHVSGRHLFLEDRGTGVRCELKSDSTAVMPGDLVEVVGFPDVSGPAAPVLREALLRRQGRMPLPVPADLSAAEGNGLEFDATRVRLKGVLVDRRRTESGWLLEIQSGVRSFAARCELREEPPNVAIGSRLELTGVYAVLGTQQVAGHPGGSFELLLDSAREIRVLARPPWWTLERLLLIVGMLAAVLVLAMLWINQLHRQVEQRGIALEKEIRARQHVEQQRLLDQERARVAQDLHDELGSDLTEVSMLLARAQSSTTSSERRSGYLEQTRLKARQMVTALDEIVWAMNPRHDSLGSLTSYFCLHADRFLGLAGIAWRLVEVSAHQCGAPRPGVRSPVQPERAVRRSAAPSARQRARTSGCGAGRRNGWGWQSALAMREAGWPF